MSKCKCCNQEITTAGCGCDVKLANEGLKDYARLLALEDEAPEILVPLDMSDAIALIDRQEQEIVTLRATLAEKEEEYHSLAGCLEALTNDFMEQRKQIAALKEVVTSLTKDVETRDDRVETLHGDFDLQYGKRMRTEEQIVALTKDMAKYKAFWDHAREIDRINFLRFEWQDILDKEVKK